MPRKPSGYVTQVEIPSEHRSRYDVILQALYGTLAVTEAARRLGLSRVRCQTLVHRAQEALVQAIIPQAAGRPAKPPSMADLEAQVKTLARENEILRTKLEDAENLFAAAGQVMRSLRTRGPRRRPKKTGDDPQEPESPTASLRSRRRSLPSARMTKMRAELDRALRALDGTGRARRRRPITAEAAATIERLVRATHGLIGAEALQRAAAVSRRQAAAEKARVVTAMERDRKARCGTVAVAAPGRIRGFDAMYLWTLDGWRYLLIFADSSVSYRTTIVVAERYDADSVAAALKLDIANHGAPLAYRLDRASCHDAPAVRQVLAQHSVLALHGPAHHPGYYGQLERQNREHRAWLEALGTVTAAALADAVNPMMHALNALWPPP